MQGCLEKFEIENSEVSWDIPDDIPNDPSIFDDPSEIGPAVDVRDLSEIGPAVDFSDDPRRGESPLPIIPAILSRPRREPKPSLKILENMEQALATTLIDYPHYDMMMRVFMADVIDKVTPISYNHVQRSNEADEWKAAMQREYDSHIKNGTWEIVPPPVHDNVDQKKHVIMKSLW